MLLDLTNPTPAIGWANNERKPIHERATADCVLSLALIHHLAISNNVPLEYIARYFSTLGSWIIIEFIPKTDKKVKKLLATRKDIFSEYTQEGFEDAFSAYFDIHAQEQIKESKRILYLMKRK